jgi:hypothetical protein
MASTTKLLTIQGGKCFYCGEKLSLEDATLDHVIPKALGGDNSEGNAVVCCRAINQALGSASPKEKLAAVINAGGKLDCPRKQSSAKSVVHSPIATKQHTEALQDELHKAFAKASTKYGGEKAMLSAVGSELRKQVSGEFAVKNFGVKSFAQFVEARGYRVDKAWCFST